MSNQSPQSSPLPRGSAPHQKVAQLEKVKAEMLGFKTLDFPAAMQAVKEGKNVTKLEWNNPNILVCLNGGRLRIKLEDGLFHDLLVSDGDILGEDWVVLE